MSHCDLNSSPGLGLDEHSIDSHVQHSTESGGIPGHSSLEPFIDGDTNGVVSGAIGGTGGVRSPFEFFVDGNANNV